ncbi:hypothetical protein [Streptomyces sp. NPDC102437]|uniref:hypothetical protein n=1 Tax=Streptomyces sp. NPDC102437 TaxID=3366175 RepID=UPI0038178C3F
MRGRGDRDTARRPPPAVPVPVPVPVPGPYHDIQRFTHGHALQLHAVHRRFLAALAALTPLLPGAS